FSRVLFRSVSTGDKDLAQLVNDHVTLVNTMSSETLDEAGVLRKFGVPPARIVDYLMLVGDAVDNIPGVEKVGPKTAAKWLAEHGSIDALVQAADGLKGVAGANLRAAIPQFDLTRRLLTVHTDCELPGNVGDLAALAPREPDVAALTTLYERYGFRSWLRELTGDPGRVPEGDARVAAEAVPAAPVQTHYETVVTWDDFDRWMQRIAAAGLVALDTETTSLDGMRARLVGLSLSTEPGCACYIPVAHRGPGEVQQLPKDEVLARMRPWLENGQARKLLHH